VWGDGKGMEKKEQGDRDFYAHFTPEGFISLETEHVYVSLPHPN
jgi:hypothetical protein